MKKIGIKDLYFGCKNYNFNSNKLETYNLFNSRRVLRSIAIYKVEKPVVRDPFRFCFGDLWAHAEFEFCVSDLFCNQPMQKVDLYTMYAEPNKDYLMSLVDNVSVSSCKEWLRDYDERIYDKRRI